jgi:hypothetical protein
LEIERFNLNGGSRSSHLSVSPDSWSGTKSPVGGETSSPIAEETTYTLACLDSAGLIVTRTATVRTVPVWHER